MGSRQLLRYGRRLKNVTAGLHLSLVPASSKAVPFAVVGQNLSLKLRCSASLAATARSCASQAGPGRGFATEAYNITKEHNSHWLGYSIGGVAAAGLAYYLFNHQRQTEAKTDAKLVSHAPTPHAAHGHLSISEFKLTDHMGNPASSDDVLGEFVMFYFGTSSNPVTNEAMTKLTETVRQIDRKTNMHYLTPVFISMDPQDEPVKLRGFVTKYHDRLIALSGEDANKALESAKAFSKDLAGKSPEGTGSSDDEVSHTCYLVNPEGELLTAFNDDDSVLDVSDTVAKHVSNYKLHHPMWHGPKAIKARHA